LERDKKEREQISMRKIVGVTMERIIKQLRRQQTEKVLVAIGLVAGVIGIYLLIMGYTKEAHGLFILLAFASGFSCGRD